DLSETNADAMSILQSGLQNFINPTIGLLVCAENLNGELSGIRSMRQSLIPNFFCNGLPNLRRFTNPQLDVNGGVMSNFGNREFYDSIDRVVHFPGEVP